MLAVCEFHDKKKSTEPQEQKLIMMERKVQVKVRHGAAIHDAAVALAGGGGGGGGARVRLADRDKGLAPGQFAAFYDGEVCLGSGVITDEGL